MVSFLPLPTRGPETGDGSRCDWFASTPCGSAVGALPASRVPALRLDYKCVCQRVQPLLHLCTPIIGMLPPAIPEIDCKNKGGMRRVTAPYAPVAFSAGLLDWFPGSQQGAIGVEFCLWHPIPFDFVVRAGA
eukprot:scaffold840_cov344-Pavlova_lutheri.AAC.57